ncbi:hypothetical protein NHX12_018168 [Muraenolepis orangiensis]|uniref:ALOG domain-containing protein n=1 Tax=Muraenolepis orangiensis TaxID=630683 RepID=A0A9Q0F0J4_9TELE|nr:hypothetical protein NHX12_018168 [Muraenolepis orangiensis]
MGTNPNRTVAVSMVAQLVEVDLLGNKEPDAKRPKESNLNLSQVCLAPATFIPSPDHIGDIPHTSLTKNTPNSQRPSKDGTPVETLHSDVATPLPVNGNQEIFPPAAPGIKTHHQMTVGSSMTGRRVSTPAEGQRDDRNATQRVKTPEAEEEQGRSKASVTSDVAASKVDMLTNDCQARVPTEPVERSSELLLQGGVTSTAKESPSGNTGNYAPCNNQRMGKGFESEHAGSEVSTPQPVCQRGVLSTATCPGTTSTVLESKVPANKNRLSSSVVDKSPNQNQCQTNKEMVEVTVTPAPVQKAEQRTQEVAPPQPALDPTVVPRTTRPPPASHGQSAGATDLNSNLTHAERGPPPAYSTRITAEKHRPTVVVPGSSALHPKRYSEASTMTSGSSTPTKQCHDVEVQAVASTCSRAVSTSPGLLPLSAVHRPGTGIPRTPDEAQSLAVLYKADGGGGSGQGLLHHQTGPLQIYIDSIVCTVATAAEGLVTEAGSCGVQSAKAVIHTEAEQQAAKPKQDNQAVGHVQMAAPPLKPVYQINIEHSAQRDGKMAAVAHPAVSSQSTIVSKTTLSDPSGVPAVSATKTPTTKASSSQLPQATTIANKPRHGDNIPTTDTTIPANTNSKSKVSKATTQCPKDQPKPSSKASAKEIGINKKCLEPERKKKEEEEGDDDDDEGKQKGKGVQEVVWDEQGMTWEVYGAGVDPESLGFAIQSHLQCKIKEQERKLITKVSQRKSIAAADSPRREKKQRRRQNIFRSMLRNARRPQCCSRPSPASVLE